MPKITISLNKMSQFGITIFTAIAMVGCGSGGGGGAVAATQVDIQSKIFNQSCTSSGCHNSGAAGGLDLRAEVMRTNTIGVTSVRSADGLPIIDPGNPDGSFIIQKLEGNLASGEGTKMPQGPPLGNATAKIQALRDWIAAGALDN